MVALPVASTIKYIGSNFKNCSNGGFPSFLPRQVEDIKDNFARSLARRIQRLPVKTSFSDSSIMSSCIKPVIQNETAPLVLLHGFDSSCLEWRYTYPLLEEAGLEAWAVDILGWGFSDLENLPPCNVATKRDHLYQVEKLVLIDASVYTEGSQGSSSLPRVFAYAGVGRLHCFLPWWEDATVDFMMSGGYSVISLIGQVKQETLIIWGEDDRIISNTFATRLQQEMPNAFLHQLPDCGHIPHVEQPDAAAKMIVDFVRSNQSQYANCTS